MMQTTVELSSRKPPSQPNSTSLADAKNWIGHCMVLRRVWLGFAAGTRCRVMCVVDFGDGLLLWWVTDDEHARDVDQLEIPFVANLFSELPVQLPYQSLLSNDTTIVQSVN